MPTDPPAGIAPDTWERAYEVAVDAYFAILDAGYPSDLAELEDPMRAALRAALAVLGCNGAGIKVLPYGNTKVASDG